VTKQEIQAIRDLPRSWVKDGTAVYYLSDQDMVIAMNPENNVMQWDLVLGWRDMEFLEHESVSGGQN